MTGFRCPRTGVRKEQVLLSFLIFGLVVFSSDAQTRTAYDSSYYSIYPNRVTGRFYLSNKFTSLTLKNDRYLLRYQPNTSINLGVGATYRWATLNIGVGFLNRTPSKGRTRYLDLQFHNYGRKFALDVLGEFYHGFYLFPAGKGSADESFYKRPDLHVDEIGANFQYILNHRRFSYRSSFLQNEWQKKSAGSFLVGVEVYYGRISADSTIVPALVDLPSSRLNTRTVRFFEIGPNAGYAYTLVVKRHYFLTASGSLSLDYGTNSVQSDASEVTTHGFIPNKTLKLCGGYNSSRYALSVLYVSNNVNTSPNAASPQVRLNTGNVRVIFVHRFIPNQKEKKILNALPVK